MNLAIRLADGFEESEALITVDILRRANMIVDTITINDDKTVTGSHDIKIVTDLTLDEADIEQYGGLILPGGMPGVTNLQTDGRVLDAISSFNDEGKYLFAICAAPSILVKEGILDDQYYTCYPGFQVEDSSAIYSDENVVIDKNIITGKAMGATFDFALSIVHKLSGLEACQNVKDKIYYK